MASGHERPSYAQVVHGREASPAESGQPEGSHIFEDEISNAELPGNESLPMQGAAPRQVKKPLALEDELAKVNLGEKEPPSALRAECQPHSSASPVCQTLSGPEDVFPLKKLPQELRLQIYANELYHIPMAGKPALIQALAKDKLLADDYVRAVKMWEYGSMTNFRVSSANIEIFQKMPMKEMLKIKHLTIAVDTFASNDESDKENDIFRKLKSNKSLLKNNFESIILDLLQHENDAHYADYPRSYLVKFAEHAIIASSRPYRAILRLRSEGSQIVSENPSSISYYQLFLSTRPRITMDSTNHGFLWTWDNGDKILRKESVEALIRRTGRGR